MDILTIVSWLVASVAILAPAYYFLKERQNRRQAKLRNLPYVSLKNPLLQALTKEKQEVTKLRLIKTVGKAFVFKQLHTFRIMLAEPELIQTILTKEFTNFSNRIDASFVGEVFGDSLFFSKNEQWKRIRSIVTPAFSTGKIRRMKPNLDSIVVTMLKNFDISLRKSSTLEIKKLVSAYSMDAIIQNSFGIKVDSFSEKNNEIVLNAQKLFGRDFNLKNVWTFVMVFFFPKVAKMLDIRFLGDITDYFSKFSIEIIRQKRKMLEKYGSSNKASNFIELMLEAEMEANDAEQPLQQKQQQQTNNVGSKKVKYITNEEIIAQCVLFFVGGFDSTAATMTIACYLIAVNPEIQEKLYQETVTVLKRLSSENPEAKDTYELVTIESLSQFAYLSAVVEETLRCHPPVTFFERIASQDMVLESADQSTRINVKKDDTIQVPIYSLHRDAGQFPEPEQFRPERFLKRESERTFHKYAYLPFGSGPRNCVAKSFALLEVKLAILHTIIRYRFSACSKTKLDFFLQNNVITPRDMFLKVERRPDWNQH